MRGESRVNLMTATIFFVALFLPLLGKTFPALNPTREIVEKRELATAPAFDRAEISTFAGQYESYFNDHFGFRNALIHANNLVKLKVFQVSGSPKVLAGRRGWLYYTGNHVIEDLRGLNPLSSADLNQWRSVLEDKQNWLAARGIDYLLVIAPNKAAVYPEFLPRGLGPVGNETPVDQLVTYLRQYTRINVIDLRESLLAQKERGPLFLRLDTHWTPMGAFLAYRNVAGQIATRFPEVTPLTMDDMRTAPRLRDGGDLASMLGLQNELKEEVLGIGVREPVAARVGKVGKPRDPFAMATSDEALPRAVMFRDSFATGLVPFLSEDFSHIEYIWRRWNHKMPIEKIVTRLQPDIIIEEIVARKIRNLDVVTFGLQPAPTMAYPRRLFAFGPDPASRAGFQPLKQVALEIWESEIRVTSTGNDPHFMLPNIDFKGQEVLLFSLEFTSPAPSSLQLFFQTEAEPFFNEKNSYRVRTTKGQNKVEIPVNAAALNGKVRIDPGSVPGEYVFLEIEVRGAG